MTFRDSKLRQHWERVAAIATGCQPEQLTVLGLMDACYWFRATEGEDSPRAAEAIEHLLSEELRPALRRWYRDAGDDMNDSALRFRDRLGELAGERFE